MSALTCINITPKFVRIRRGVVSSSSKSSVFSSVRLDDGRRARLWTNETTAQRLRLQKIGSPWGKLNRHYLASRRPCATTSGWSSNENGERRTKLGAISDPSSQTPSSSSPQGIRDDEKAETVLDQSYELNGENFSEQTVATPSDGPIDVLHASSKQTKS